LAIVTALLPGRQLNYRGKHVLVTGGSEGLGRAIALQLVAAGADVTIVGRRADALQRVVDEANTSNSPTRGRIFTQTADVTSPQAIKCAVGQAQASVGPIDILLPNAGKSIVGYMVEHPIQSFRDSMELNYFGTLNTVNAVLPTMVQRQEGCICFITSAAALASYVGFSAYSPTKYAVRGLADCLRNELSSSGISIHVAYPGSMDTPGFELEQLTKPTECKAIEASETLYKPEAVASSILKDLKHGVHNMYCGDIGISLLGVLSASMSPRCNPALDVLLFPVGVVATKKSKPRPTADELSSNDASGGGLTVEQIYQKKTQLEHILLRPDTYVGSIEPAEQTLWVYDDENSKMVQKKVTICPGLYKIFDEIIVNACDNKQRDSTMDTLKVTIDSEKGEISVWNNGNGIPVVMHKEHNVYVPELIFGHLLTGSNFDDKKKKTTGGRNGYGAKLANIFSKEFVVETASREQGKRYRQVFSDNMSVKGAPKITSWSKKDFTCITFTPDFKRFQMTGLDDDIVALFKKRVYDIAGVTDKSLNVYLNEEKIAVKSFSQYVALYGTADVIFDKPDERWQVGLGLSDDGFQQVSFVNGICTTKGGQHVNYLADQITTKLIAVVKKRNKGEAVKPAYIKNHLCLYVSALIDNPAFDSQRKVHESRYDFHVIVLIGCDDMYSPLAARVVEKSGLVENILSFAKLKQTAELKKTSGTKSVKLTGISKLDDANFAGSAKGKDCTLILTEGDSAKALAMSGLAVVGRDYYGVFPLKGKLLNVREASHSVIVKNEEIQNIVKILGLKYGTTYDSTKSLRYGHLMIMADQDHDGSHIKGLVINFIHHFWPSLMGLDNFVQEFITPIVKATKGNRSEVFYTIPEYEAWRGQMNNAKGWYIKYYKGLGTSKPEEAREYFSDLNTHQIGFTYNGEPDGDAIDMAFSKKRVEDRKEWLRAFVPGTFVDYAELILFSMADNIRSIPSMVDGFKPSQRKVLFSCFKRNLKKEIKVAQLSGYISEHSAYHHGEVNLHGTIIGMAQNFVGSNNINLLAPNGQFGTRLMGGKDAASARYVFTNLEYITRLVFNPLDDAILNYLEDEGQSIEPQWYMPIIPMSLVNGSDGIGTGWSCGIPNYNPLDVIENLRRRIQAEPMNSMVPFYRGFKGDIVQKGGTDNFLVQGKFEVIDDSTIVISELPVKTWTQSYKQYLETLLEANTIKDFKENHTDTTVLFTVILSPESLAAIQNAPGGIPKKFKLESSLAISNMHLFDSNGQIKHYSSPLDIIEEFYGLRLEHYGFRKAAILKRLEHDILVLSNKMRFILAVIEGELIVNNRKKKELLEELRKQKYDPMPKNVTAPTVAAAGEEEQPAPEDDDEDNVGVSAKDYDYLLSMALWSLTAERVQNLRNDLEAKNEERDVVFATTLETMWLKDLDELEVGLGKDEENRLAQEHSTKKQAGKATSGKSQTKRKPAKKSAKESDTDSGSDFELAKSKAKKAKVEKPKIKTQFGAEKPLSTVWKKPQAIVKKEGKAPKKERTASSEPKPAKVFKLFEKKQAIVESSEDEEVLSLAERLKRRAMVEKKVDSDEDDVFSVPTAQKVGAKTMPSIAQADSDDEFSFAASAKKTAPALKKAAKKPTPKPKVAKKKAVESSSVDKPKKRPVSVDSDDDTFKFSDSEPVTKKLPAPKAKASKPASGMTLHVAKDTHHIVLVGTAAKRKTDKAPSSPKKKKQKQPTWSDDESSAADDDDVHEPVEPKERPGRAARATKQVVYKLDSSDEEQDAASDFEDDANDSE
ncbi:hypothetical protein DYB35_003287, partial [Aphanomyces astaci]